MSKALRHMEPAVRDLVVKRRLKNMAGGAGTCAALDYKAILDREQKAKAKKAEEGLQNLVEVANEEVPHGITGVQLLMAKIDKEYDPLSPLHNPDYGLPDEAIVIKGRFVDIDGMPADDPTSAQGAGMDAGKDIKKMTPDETEFVDEHIVGGA